jgi:hypothetical protein
VNIRRDLHLEGPFAFGLVLGSFVVHHEVPEEIALEELARAIGCQTRRIKEGRLYLGAGLELAFGRLLASFYSAERRRRLYQKHYPLWGGVSNMDLNAYWPSPGESAVIDYLRGVSTGPITPLVLSITTFGEAANVGLSYRSSIFSAADIEQVKAGFLDPLSPKGANP